MCACVCVCVRVCLLQAYWCEQRDVGDHAVLREVAAGHGVDAEALSHSDTASQQLRANTAEVAERGGFGVPRWGIVKDEKDGGRKNKNCVCL